MKSEPLDMMGDDERAILLGLVDADCPIVQFDDCSAPTSGTTSLLEMSHKLETRGLIKPYPLQTIALERATWMIPKAIWRHLTSTKG
jgi:hypothetical protein